MAENNQRDVDRLVADLSVSSTRSSRVRMVPAGGHFAQGDGAAAPAPIWQDSPGVGLTAALFRLSGRRRSQAPGRRAVPGAVFL